MRTEGVTRSPLTSGRDVVVKAVVKKDILAIITFATTGVLFYLIQVGGPPAKAVSVNQDVGVVEAVQDGSCDTVTPKALITSEDGGRDS